MAHSELLLLVHRGPKIQFSQRKIVVFFNNRNFSTFFLVSWQKEKRKESRIKEQEKRKNKRQEQTGKTVHKKKNKTKNKETCWESNSSSLPLLERSSRFKN